MSDPSSTMFRHRVLSRAEQDALLARYREMADLHGPKSAQATAARNVTVCANMRLVAHVAKRFPRLPSGMEAADLHGYGVLGLIEAVERFDLARGAQFSTYATWWIRHAIGRHLDDLGATIRVPVHAQAALTKDRAGDADERTQRTLDAARNARSVLSLNAPIAADDARSTELGERVADQSESTLDEMERLQDVARASAALERLPERFQRVLRARMNGETLKCVGDGLDEPRSRERVRQLEAEALNILRRELRSA